MSEAVVPAAADAGRVGARAGARAPTLARQGAARAPPAQPRSRPGCRRSCCSRSSSSAVLLDAGLARDRRRLRAVAAGCGRRRSAARPRWPRRLGSPARAARPSAPTGRRSSPLRRRPRRLRTSPGTRRTSSCSAPAIPLVALGVLDGRVRRGPPRRRGGAGPRRVALALTALADAPGRRLRVELRRPPRRTRPVGVLPPLFLVLALWLGAARRGPSRGPRASRVAVAAPAILLPIAPLRDPRGGARRVHDDPVHAPPPRAGAPTRSDALWLVGVVGAVARVPARRRDGSRRCWRASSDCSLRRRLGHARQRDSARSRRSTRGIASSAGPTRLGRRSAPTGPSPSLRRRAPTGRGSGSTCSGTARIERVVHPPEHAGPRRRSRSAAVGPRFDGAPARPQRTAAPRRRYVVAADGARPSTGRLAGSATQEHRPRRPGALARAAAGPRRERDQRPRCRTATSAPRTVTVYACGRAGSS